MYSENYIKINNYITLMNPEELIEEENNLDIEICEKCNGEINCKKDNVYILTRMKRKNYGVNVVLKNFGKNIAIMVGLVMI